MQSPQIEVGIMLAQQLSFQFLGKYTETHTQQEYRGKYIVRQEEGKLALYQKGTRLLSADTLYFAPHGAQQLSFVLHNVTIGIDFHWEQQEDQQFQAALKLFVFAGKVQAVNVLSIEDYLISVISSEMRGDSSLALLKAHAIISRSWLLAQIEKQNNLRKQAQSYQQAQSTDEEYIRWWDREDHEHFHVCADDHCQRYQGVVRAQRPNVIRAVTETQGIVLTYNGQIADARFSKCCGGVTERFENCWEDAEHPYLQATYDAKQPNLPNTLHQEKDAEAWLRNAPQAFCNTNKPEILKQVLNDYDWTAKDFYRWEVVYAAPQLGQLIRRRSGIDFGDIEALVPVERGTSARLIKLKIIGTKKTLVIGKELLIRRWLSESHLYSSAFVVDTYIDKGIRMFKLTGGGWGHGVGLCQIGAAVMGHEGYSYREILAHYFAHTALTPYAELTTTS